jgi:hypothetical protein
VERVGLAARGKERRGPSENLRRCTLSKGGVGVETAPPFSLARNRRRAGATLSTVAPAFCLASCQLSAAARLPISLLTVNFERFRQLVFHFPRFGEAALFRLGEEGALAIGEKRDLEDATAARYKGHPARHQLEMAMEDAFRQPGGFLQVPSGGAVFDPHRGTRRSISHRSLLCRHCIPRRVGRRGQNNRAQP